MEHPFISMLIAGAIYNRVEDAVYLHQAKKTGTPYRGHRWNYGIDDNKSVDTKVEVDN